MPIRFNSISQKWFYRFSLRKRSYFKGGFRTRALAVEAEVKLHDRLIKAESYPELLTKDMTLAEASKWFFENYSLISKRSWKNDRGRIKVMVEFFGQTKLSEITPSDVSSFRVHLKKKGLCSHTVNHYQALLKAIYNRLRKFDKYTGENPATKIEMERVPKARVRFLYPSEEKLLTPTVMKVPQLWPYYFVALHTGMRISEICSIRVKDVSLLIGTIFVPNSKTYRSRHVPISDQLSEFLKSLVKSKHPDNYALGDRSVQWVSRSFRCVCLSVGLHDLKFHDLRHTFAHRLLSQGVPIYKVSKILGHSSVVVTEQHYGHLAMSDLKTAVDKIDGIISTSCTKIAFSQELEVMQATNLH